MVSFIVSIYVVSTEESILENGVDSIGEENSENIGRLVERDKRGVVFFWNHLYCSSKDSTEFYDW